MWNILEQEEKIGKSSFPTRCKRIRRFPTVDKDTGEMRFGWLKFPLFQIIVQNDYTELKLKLNLSNPAAPVFSVKQADTLGFSTITVGEKRNKRTIPDVLSPKIRIPGVKWDHTEASFAKWAERVLGTLVAAEVMQLFINKWLSLDRAKAA